MKKTYIEPKNTVVLIKPETMIAESTPQATLSETEGDKITTPGGFGARETVIEAPDAWEEW